MRRRALIVLSRTVAVALVGIAGGERAGAIEVPPVRFPVVSGIGAALAIEDAGPRIAEFVPGSAAEKSGGLHEGDRILSVREGERGVEVKLKGKKLGEVASLIRGPVGTVVILQVAPADGGPARSVSLKRDAVAVPGRTTYDELIGKPAPKVQLTALEGGERVELSKYAGKVMVVDFWATWCGTCFAPVDRMQELTRAHPEWEGRVAMLTVTVDSDPQAARKVVEARGWKQTTHLAIDRADLEAMKIEAVPTVLIVSPEGKIVAAGDPHAISIENEVIGLLPARP